MAHQAPKVDWDEESHADKFSRKAKESPFMVMGKFQSLFKLRFTYKSFIKHKKMNEIT